MATSGSKSVAVTSYDTLKFSWSESSQSVANNTTTISWKMELIAGSAGRISSTASKDWKVVVNGTTYSGTNTVGISNNSTKTLASGSTTIKHNTDGTKSFSYSFSQEFAITFSGSSIGTKSGSGSGTLDTIPRASSVTATSVNVGSNSTIKISRASSSFTHTLTYTFGSLTGTIASKTTSTSVSWTVPTSFYAQMTTVKSKSCKITCTTYSGSTNIGSKSTTMTVSVPSSSAPTLNPTVVDSNSVTTALTGDTSKFVKYYSNAQFSIGASAKNSATISSQSVKCGSKSSTSSSGTLSAVESATFVFTAKDSRGYSVSQTVTKTLIDYVHLTCSLTASMTVDGVISFQVNGNYFNGSFGSVANALTIEYRYKANDGDYGSWYTTTATLSGNTYSVDTSISGLDYRTKYTIQARAVDKLENISSAEKTVSCIPVFDWGENDFNFNVPIIISSNSANRGINFLNSEGNYDVIKVQDGKLYFMPNYPTNTTQYKMVVTAGDVISLRDNTPFASYISNGKKTIYFTIPINKPFVGVSNASLSGKIEMRGLTGYYYSPTTKSSTVDLNNISTEKIELVTYITGSVIQVYVTFASELLTATTGTTTVTNNTTMTIVPNGTLDITFS